MENTIIFGQCQCTYDEDTKILKVESGKLAFENGQSFYSKAPDVEVINFPSKKIIENGREVSPVRISSMVGLFKNLTNLKQINHLDMVDFVSEVGDSKIDFRDAFFGCKSLEIIDKELFRGLIAKNIDNMFYACEKLKKIDLSLLDISNIASLNCVFYRCKSLEEIVFPKTTFLIEDGKSFYQTFYLCEKLKKVNLEDLNGSNFYNLVSTFNKCLKIEVIDLSGFKNLFGLHNYNYIFLNCEKLKKIYVSSDTFNYVTPLNNDASIFLNCASLVGDAGTRYDPTYSDDACFKIDDGDTNPGYFSTHYVKYYLLNSKGGLTYFMRNNNLTE